MGIIKIDLNQGDLTNIQLQISSNTRID